MRRADGLYDLSRRQFVGVVAGCAGLALAGCTDGDQRGAIQTGGLNGPDGMDGSHLPDAGGPHADAAVSATCPATGATDVGAPATFAANTPVHFTTGNFFVVRDTNGLYALTARCTHEGATCVTQSGNFYCPRHGATFTYNGGIISGPVVTGLVHYAMCTLAGGHIGVIASQTVSASQRLVA